MKYKHTYCDVYEPLDFIEQRKVVDRPDWDTYLMALALIASKKSCDSETRHGAVLTDEYNRIISMGYNSFPSGLKDDILPNSRPEKYWLMVHAEMNCLNNSRADLLAEKNLSLYVTGRCCLHCLISISTRKSIRNLNLLDQPNSRWNHESLRADPDYSKWNYLVKENNLNVNWLRFNPEVDFEWVKKGLSI